MRVILTLILFNIFFMCCTPWSSYGAHPALAIMGQFQTIDHDSDQEVIPYTVNIMAIYLLKKGENIKDIHQYILWYFDHLNYPDSYGLTGTIYDYEIRRNGEERSLNKYDSADSYAATFFLLLYNYYKATGSEKLIKEHKKNLEDMAYVISLLQDEDGLTKAIPGRDEKYLMDNCESYGGINAYIELSKHFRWDSSAYYEAVKESIKTGIIEQLYDENKKIFCWAVERENKYPSHWMRYYPDAFAQLFPILHRLLEDKPALKKDLWRHFLTYHKNILDHISTEQKLIYELTRDVMSNGNINDN